MKNEIDPEVIKNIADIARMNDPALNNLRDTIDNEAVDKAFEKNTEGKETEKVVREKVTLV